MYKIYGIIFIVIGVLFDASLFLPSLSARAAVDTGYSDLKNNYNKIQQANQIEDFGSEKADSQYQNPLLDTLCQVIVFMQGRFGRAVALSVLFSMGIMFYLGKVTWTNMVVVGCGIGLLFGAKSIALVVLPYYITTNASGNNTQANIVTADAIKKVCPEI